MKKEKIIIKLKDRPKIRRRWLINPATKVMPKKKRKARVNEKADLRKYYYENY